MSRILKSILISIVITVPFCSCVKTEKTRTIKKVDASQIQEYKVDMSKSRLRLALDMPEYIEAGIRSMLFTEIDDGQHRYGFPGTVFTVDTSDETNLLYSPWINTPDSGEIIMSFRLAYDTAANIVSDRMAVRLRPGWLWLVVFGIQDCNPCAQWPEAELCRTYTLPRGIEGSDGDRLSVVWRGSVISTPAEPQN